MLKLVFLFSGEHQVRETSPIVCFQFLMLVQVVASLMFHKKCPSANCILFPRSENQAKLSSLKHINGCY